MTIHSDNGWPVIESPKFTGSNPRLRRYTIPGVTEKITLRDGSAGFILCHMAMWYNEKLLKIDGPKLDDWGWNFRPIAGTDVFSNHASGTAIDINALKFPQGTENMTKKQAAAVRKRLKLYKGIIRWGGDYKIAKKDQMHFEINKTLAVVEARARQLMSSPRGKKLLAANPGLKGVILS